MSKPVMGRLAWSCASLLALAACADASPSAGVPSTTPADGRRQAGGPAAAGDILSFEGDVEPAAADGGIADAADAGPADTGPADTGPTDSGADAGVADANGPLQPFIVSSSHDKQVLRFYADGNFRDAVAAGAPLASPAGLAFGADGAIWIASQGSNQILRYASASGSLLSVFASSTQGVSTPVGITFGPDGALYVANRGSASVLRFDATTGAVTTFASGISGPEALLFGPAGLYVSTTGGQILLRDATNGDPIRTFASGLAGPEGLVLDHSNRLYVAESKAGRVTRFDATSGTALGTFAAGNLTTPFGVAFGRDGNLYVVDSTQNQVVRYNGTTGAYIGVFIQPPVPPGGLDVPTFILEQ